MQAGFREGLLRYRADIDGLRAVAVLAVVGYHAGIKAVSGGFVGVDVFFVISGFLIGSIILNECRDGQFSLARFYERRIRRIMPALLAVIAATFGLAYVYALPAELLALGRSAVATLLFGSNIYFLQQSDYFDAPAETQPLLHTWSLAIEEQFYLFAPLMIAFIHRRFPQHLRASVAGAAALSLLLCIVLTPRLDAAAFYLLPTRAWELLLGVMLALGMGPRLETRWARNVAAAAGLAMIVAAMLTFTASTPFPGLPALLPCLGAALIILAGQSGGSVVGAVLSLRPMVFIGLISYSLYLWHWPIMVFQRLDAFLIANASPVLEATLTIGCSLILATLSWRFVERPFRSHRTVPRPMLLRVTATSAAAIVVFAAAAIGLQGLPGRFPPDARMIAAYLDYNTTPQYRTGRCMISDGYSASDFDAALCLARSPASANYLLLGDSHAAHLWYGLEAVLPDVRVLQATASGCKPFRHAPLGASQRCRHVMDRVFTDPAALEGVEKLLIAGRWEAGDEARIADTLDWARAQGVEVVLFGPIVQYKSAVPRILASAQRWQDETLLDRQRLSSLADLDRDLHQLAQAKGVQYVSLWRTMCDQKRCMAQNGRAEPLQFDYGHLTAKGSVMLAQLLVDTGALR